MKLTYLCMECKGKYTEEIPPCRRPGKEKIICRDCTRRLLLERIGIIIRHNPNKEEVVNDK